MKQLILIGVLTGLLAATIPLQAQVTPRDSDAARGSRLELGRTGSTSKKTVPTLSSQRFSIVPNPASVQSDRPVNIHKNAPINEHYRSLMVSRSSSKTPARTATAVESPSSAPAETRAMSLQERLAEDRMFGNEHIKVSNAYPNPADNVAEVDYELTGPISEAKIVLLNVLGSPVAEYGLETGDHKVRMQTRDLATGYYLYQLTVDGKKVATKRLLVRHQ
ncbi:T9SS type A sorting domain-containing protein [Spirosoma sp. KUDC1026]|uniref:T9SS type A sorting domain-containing protein n=1 Tax=Spirosoma sp. KUDC1026 TaxID=2745947 RepID=UPI00159BAEF7|nr:T9SS type A sorting domain-containing protein [Spirosoma sp. KUDC1026]QKZ14349.1 T9SS type A sorting domain-containing protein [Spirosoma sp. KUDC1026]